MILSSLCLNLFIEVSFKPTFMVMTIYKCYNRYNGYIIMVITALFFVLGLHS